MALFGQDDAPATPFTWGQGGARMTPDLIAAQRKVADALAADASSGGAFPVGTRGAGLWTQGLARLAKGVSAGLDYREADQAAKANADDNKAMIAALLGGGAAPAAAPAAVAASSAAPSPASLDPETTGYINNAASKFGIDPAYLTRTAMIESGGNPNSVNKVSGASGLFQFMPSTAKEYELTNPLDPEDSAMAAAELAKDNRDALKTALGRDPTNAELYLAHQQGAGATALLSNPNAPAISVLGPNGRAAVMNNGGNERMTAGQFANMWLNKYNQGAQPPAAAFSPGNAPVVAADDSAAPAPAVVKVAAAMPAPVAAAPGPVAAVAPTAPVAAAPSPAVAKVSGALGAPAPATPTTLTTPGSARVAAALQAVTSPYADPGTKQVAAMVLQQEMKPKAAAPYKDADGNLLQFSPDGTLHSVIKANEDPTSVREYNFYKSQLPPGQPAMPYEQWSIQKARAAATSITNNVDMNSGQTYDKQLAEGLGKSHAALANGVEDAQTRARDIAAMQGAVDQIQRAGGTTGGMAPAQRLELQKSINAGAAALGFEKPFSEADISDKEFLTKFNRSMAGAQAKNAVGARVTNFEMSNFLKANPGLDMSVTGNQRLLGIQAQIEQRNIAVGNAIREATAQAISQGKKIDPVTVQHIITEYDNAHHIKDVTTGQDLTQSYALPEFQSQGNNPALSGDHGANVNKIRRFNPATQSIE